MGRRNSQTSEHGGGQTMELDAVVDQLEEIAPPPGGLGLGPPPLPPKKSSPMMYVLAVVVVALMGGLGLAAGSYLLGDEAVEPPETSTSTGAEANEPAAEVPDEEAAPGDEGGAEPDVVQLEEVVFDE